MAEFIRSSIGFYTLTAFIGLLVTGFVYVRLGFSREVHWKQTIAMYAFELAGLLVGSHLLFFIVGLPDWIQEYAGNIHSVSELLTALFYGASGLVFYGGLAGAFAGLAIFCKIYGFYAYPEFNCAAVIFPLFHMFGRVGCALNGCCYGIEYHGPLAIVYSQVHIVAGISDDIADFPRFPVQYLEAFLELLIFIFLLILYKKTKDTYSLTSIYLLIYSVIRFFDEFLRGDSARKIWGPFSTSQWISIGVFAGVMAVLLIRQIRKPEKAFFARY